MRSFDVVHWFRLLPTSSSCSSERADAVVVVVVVVVDVAGRRDAKKDTTHGLWNLLPFLSSPSYRHIFHIGYHLGPVGRRLIVQQLQEHGQLDVKQQLIT